MPAFFAHKRGSVVRVGGGTQQNSGVLPFKILMGGMDITSPGTRAIITQAGIIENGSYQFQHTLNDTIYAYVFGDRIGELQVSGVCFVESCEGGTSGFAQVMDNYRDFRIAKATSPVQLSVGELNYLGFLVGTNLDLTDAETQMGQWTMRFNTFRGGAT